MVASLTRARHRAGICFVRMQVVMRGRLEAHEDEDQVGALNAGEEGAVDREVAHGVVGEVGEKEADLGVVAQDEEVRDEDTKGHRQVVGRDHTSHLAVEVLRRRVAVFHGAWFPHHGATCRSPAAFHCRCA